MNKSNKVICFLNKQADLIFTLVWVVILFVSLIFDSDVSLIMAFVGLFSSLIIHRLAVIENKIDKMNRVK